MVRSAMERGSISSPNLSPVRKSFRCALFYFFFHEKAAGLRPEVGADDGFVVKHFGRAVYCDADFGQVGEDVFFRISRARRIRLYEQKEDGFHRPPLGVHFDVQARVCVSFEGDRFLKVHVVIREFFAARVGPARFVGQLLAADYLVFELDVGQLVFQLCGIRAFDYLRSRPQRDFKHEVVVKHLRVENAVVGQDLMVQPDAVDVVKFIFGVDSRGFLVPRVGADLAEIIALNPLQQHVVTLLLREEQVFEDFEDVIADHVLHDGPRKFYDQLADEGPRDVLHEKVVGMAARQIDVESERQRSGHDDLVLIQLRHVAVQHLAGAGFRSVKGDAFDRAGGLHGA